MTLPVAAEPPASLALRTTSLAAPSASTVSTSLMRSVPCIACLARRDDHPLGVQLRIHQQLPRRHLLGEHLVLRLQLGVARYQHDLPHGRPGRRRGAALVVAAGVARSAAVVAFAEANIRLIVWLS